MRPTSHIRILLVLFMVLSFLAAAPAQAATMDGAATTPRTILAKYRPERHTAHHHLRRAELATVSDMHHWSNPDYTRVVVTVSHDVTFEYHHLPKSPDGSLPPRLYIDITGARLAPGVKDIKIGDGLLKNARIAQYRPDIVRVVLDLDSIEVYKVFSFSDPFRIIIDVRGDRRAELTKGKPPELEAAAPVPAARAVPAD